MITKKELQKIKVGDKIRITTQPGPLADCGCEYAGQTVVVTKLDFGNDCVYSGTGTYFWNTVIEEVISTTGSKRTGRFNRAHVEEIRKNGGNDYLRKEMTSRIHSAREMLPNCLTSTDGKDNFNASMAAATEQLRQAKLIHKSLAK